MSFILLGTDHPLDSEEGLKTNVKHSEQKSKDTFKRMGFSKYCGINKHCWFKFSNSVSEWTKRVFSPIISVSVISVIGHESKLSYRLSVSAKMSYRCIPNVDVWVVNVEMSSQKPYQEQVAPGLLSHVAHSEHYSTLNYPSVLLHSGVISSSGHGCPEYVTDIRFWAMFKNEKTCLTVQRLCAPCVKY